METDGRRSRPFILMLLGAALGLVLLLPSAASARNMDSRKVKDLVARLIHERTGLATTQIECPRRIPMQEGQKSTCTATLSDDTEIAIDFVQTNDRGDVSFRVRDAEALAVLGPPAQELVERWLAGQFDAIHRDAHGLLADDVSPQTLAELLMCNAADYGGLDRAGEADKAVIHRQRGSGEVHVPLQFDGGLEVYLLLTFVRDGSDWRLAGLNLPPAPQDSTEFDQEDLLATVEQLFADANRGRWAEVYSLLSYELRLALSIDELQRELDDPFDQGPAERSRILAVARNAHGLPVASVMTQRERGPSRSLFSFRSCGDTWKVRTANLIPPETPPLLTEPAQAEAFLVAEARKQGVDLSASCPGEELTMLEGLTYTCTARHPSGVTAPIELTITDNQGSVRWQLLAGDDWP